MGSKAARKSVSDDSHRDDASRGRKEEKMICSGQSSRICKKWRVLRLRASHWTLGQTGINLGPFNGRRPEHDGSPPASVEVKPFLSFR